MPGELINAAQELKMRTAAAHQEVEALLVPRINDLKRSEDFAIILKGFYCFLKPLEPKLNEFITPAVLPDMPQRRKIHLLEESLDSFNMPKGEPCEAQIPVATSVEDALGIMYVLEGSTLGGKSIVRMLTSNPGLQLTPAQYHYFNPYTENTGTMWKTFQAALNNTVRGERELQIVIHAANETFRCLKETLLNIFNR